MVQVGTVPQSATALVSLEVNWDSSSRSGATPKSELPVVTVGPVVKRWCVVHYRLSTDLDRMIRNAVPQEHRKWDRRLVAWLIRPDWVKFALALLDQHGVRVIDVRRAAA